MSNQFTELDTLIANQFDELKTIADEELLSASGGFLPLALIFPVVMTVKALQD